MKLIVGLGNPGPQYARTRHNVGFMVVDRLQGAHPAGGLPKARFKSLTSEVTLGSERCLLMKPTTFMNLSGQAVGEAVGFFKIDPVNDLLVVVDDLYLPTGAVRLRPGGGTGGHNGLEDVHRALGRDDYPRLRIGVGLLPSGGKPAHMDQADYVLSRFTPDEEPLLDAALNKAVGGSEAWASRGLNAAMNMVNAPTAAREPKPPREERGDSETMSSD